MNDKTDGIDIAKKIEDFAKKEGFTEFIFVGEIQKDKENGQLTVAGKGGVPAISKFSAYLNFYMGQEIGKTFKMG